MQLAYSAVQWRSGSLVFFWSIAGGQDPVSWIIFSLGTESHSS